MKLPFTKQFTRLSWSFIALALALIVATAVLLDHFDPDLFVVMATLSVAGTLFYAGFRYIRERWVLGHPTPNFKTLAETTAAGIIVYAGENVVYANRQASTISGYSRAELSQLRLWGLVHPDYRLEARQRALERLEGRRPRERYELKILTKAGEQRWVEIAADGIAFNGGRAGLVTAYDITGRKLAEAAARQAINEEKTAKENVEIARERLSNILECISDAFFAVDKAQRVLYLNKRATEMLGRPAEQVVGQSIDSVFPRETCLSFIEAFERSLGSGMPDKHEYYFREWQRWFEVCLYPSADFVSILFNELTQQRRADEALLESEMRFRTLFTQVAVGLALVQSDGRPVMVNDKLCEILGYSREQLLEQGFAVLSGAPDYPAFSAKVKELLDGQMTELRALLRYASAGGSPRSANVTVSLTSSAQGDPRNLIYVVEDMTARMLTEERLSFISTHDVLTGLPTRNLFLDRLQHACAEAHGSGRLIAVVLLNLKRFKQINETLGLSAGDLLLQHAGARLSRIAATTVARFGGDEFALLFGAGDENDITQRVQAIVEQFDEPFSLDGRALHVKVKAGIAVYPSDATESEMLLRDAAIALTRSRADNHTTFHFYATEMNVRALERLSLEEAMHRALARKQFILHYQPQVNCRGEIICFEALLRWQHAELGLMTASDFVPIAEESGFISTIGEWVLHEACEQHHRWRSSVPANVRIAVNVSPQQFGPHLVPQVNQILKETSTPGSALEFEITETGLMRNADASRETLAQLSALGIRFAIDDFGTGYSSLNYLKRFSIDVLKIDRSFVTGIPSDKQDTGISAAIIAMAHNLGMSVVAEGVETQTQLDFLYDHGCDAVQGYYFSPAVAEHKVAAWLAATPPFTPFC